MKKHIGLITENKSAIKEYVMQLNSVFGDTVSVSASVVDECISYDFKKETILLTSAYSSADFFELKKTHFFKGKTIIPINLSLKRKPLLRLNTYSKGTKALLVNVSKLMAEETITQLYQAGYSNIEFIAYYPGCELREPVELAVTPDEAEYVPEGVAEVIDIGPRQIDIMTIVELAAKLNCEYILETNRFFSFFERQMSTSTGFSILMEQNQTFNQKLSTIIQMFNGGIIGINPSYEVFDCNYTAASMLGKKRSDILSTNASLFFSMSALEKCRTQQVAVKTKTKAENERQLDVTLIPIIRGMRYFGAYAAIAYSTDEKKSKEACSFDRKGHVAKYRFSDICGNSREIKQTIELAKKMARTDSSVLITGESGTGKELFAHAIHNNSARAEGPFIAINCAALPENLLESELFGYDDGAFTGARKGGKTGLLELANNGSVFLDEIEGMAPSTQLKLLRVIQEREIMRIGGDRIIPINVRIISASNQELLPLIETGGFRHDLFYRVSTLPLDLPPLRRRKEDILILIEEFKKDLNIVFTLTEEAKTMLINYRWPGNIRELRNCVEYLGCHSVPVIEAENLPFTIRGETSGKRAECGRVHSIETQILAVLAENSCGRKLLREELLKYGITVTEGQLRGKLRELKDMGFIVSETGRGGSKITDRGIEEYNKRINI
ncbi:sigma 54-interacting transcriptional regulator [Lachnospiraceae bacterium NSJ-143]|nr:sigma 54-interacting transcriptional regulator [Lachnospiraceae bacterium NSJ-143]